MIPKQESKTPALETKIASDESPKNKAILEKVSQLLAASATDPHPLARIKKAYAAVEAIEYVEDPDLVAKLTAHGIAPSVKIRAATPSLEVQLKLSLAKRTVSFCHGVLNCLRGYPEFKLPNGQINDDKISAVMERVFNLADAFIAKTTAQKGFGESGEAFKEYLDQEFNELLRDMGREIASSRGITLWGVRTSSDADKIQKDLIQAERLANWERRPTYPIATAVEDKQISHVQIDSPQIGMTDRQKLELDAINSAKPPAWFEELRDVEKQWWRENLERIKSGELASPPATYRKGPLACNVTKHTDLILSESGTLLSQEESYRRSTIPPIDILKSGFGASPERLRLADLIAEQLLTTTANTKKGFTSYWDKDFRSHLKYSGLHFDKSLLTPLPVDSVNPESDNNMRMRNETRIALRAVEARLKAGSKAGAEILLISNWPINGERTIRGRENCFAVAENINAKKRLETLFADICNNMFSVKDRPADYPFNADGTIDDAKLKKFAIWMRENIAKFANNFAEPQRNVKAMRFCMGLAALADYRDLWQACGESNDSDHYHLYKKNNIELFAAAQEILMANALGGEVTNGCKSGKDRKAAELVQANSMAEYYIRYQTLPSYREGVEPDTAPARQRFVEIFARLYQAGHHQAISGDSAYGCDACLDGQGSLTRKWMFKGKIISPMIAQDIKDLIGQGHLTTQSHLGRLNKPKIKFEKKFKKKRTREQKEQAALEQQRAPLQPARVITSEAVRKMELHRERLALFSNTYIVKLLQQPQLSGNYLTDKATDDLIHQLNELIAARAEGHPLSWDEEHQVIKKAFQVMGIHCTESEINAIQHENANLAGQLAHVRTQIDPAFHEAITHSHSSVWLNFVRVGKYIDNIAKIPTELAQNKHFINALLANEVYPIDPVVSDSFVALNIQRAKSTDLIEELKKNKPSAYQKIETKFAKLQVNFKSIFGDTNFVAAGKHDPQIQTKHLIDYLQELDISPSQLKRLLEERAELLQAILQETGTKADNPFVGELNAVAKLIALLPQGLPLAGIVNNQLRFMAEDMMKIAQESKKLNKQWNEAKEDSVQELLKLSTKLSYPVDKGFSEWFSHFEQDLANFELQLKHTDSLGALAEFEQRLKDFIDMASFAADTRGFKGIINAISNLDDSIVQRLELLSELEQQYPEIKNHPLYTVLVQQRALYDSMQEGTAPWQKGQKIIEIAKQWKAMLRRIDKCQTQAKDLRVGIFASFAPKQIVEMDLDEKVETKGQGDKRVVNVKIGAQEQYDEFLASEQKVIQELEQECKRIVDPEARLDMQSRLLKLQRNEKRAQLLHNAANVRVAFTGHKTDYAALLRMLDQEKVIFDEKRKAFVMGEDKKLILDEKGAPIRDGTALKNYKKLLAARVSVYDKLDMIFPKYPIELQQQILDLDRLRNQQKMLYLSETLLNPLLSHFAEKYPNLLPDDPSKLQHLVKVLNDAFVEGLTAKEMRKRLKPVVLNLTRAELRQVAAFNAVITQLMTVNIADEAQLKEFLAAHELELPEAAAQKFIVKLPQVKQTWADHLRKQLHDVLQIYHDAERLGELVVGESKEPLANWQQRYSSTDAVKQQLQYQFAILEQAQAIVPDLYDEYQASYQKALTSLDELQASRQALLLKWFDENQIGLGRVIEVANRLPGEVDALIDSMNQLPKLSSDRRSAAIAAIKKQSKELSTAIAMLQRHEKDLNSLIAAKPFIDTFDSDQFTDLQNALNDLDQANPLQVLADQQQRLDKVNDSFALDDLHFILDGITDKQKVLLTAGNFIVAPSDGVFGRKGVSQETVSAFEEILRRFNESIQYGMLDMGLFNKLLSCRWGQNILKNNPDVVEQVRLTKAAIVTAIANDLVQLDRELFLELTEEELTLNQGQFKPDQHENLARLVNYNIRLNTQVVRSVLENKTTEVVALNLEQWISVALECQKKGAFNSARVIVKAFSSPPLDAVVEAMKPYLSARTLANLTILKTSRDQELLLSTMMSHQGAVVPSFDTDRLAESLGKEHKVLSAAEQAQRITAVAAAAIKSPMPILDMGDAPKKVPHLPQVLTGLQERVRGYPVVTQKLPALKAVLLTSPKGRPIGLEAKDQEEAKELVAQIKTTKSSPVLRQYDLANAVDPIQMISSKPLRDILYTGLVDGSIRLSSETIEEINRLVSGGFKGRDPHDRYAEFIDVMTDTQIPPGLMDKAYCAIDRAFIQNHIRNLLGTLDTLFTSQVHDLFEGDEIIKQLQRVRDFLSNAATAGENESMIELYESGQSQLTEFFAALGEALAARLRQASALKEEDLALFAESADQLGQQPSLAKLQEIEQTITRKMTDREKLEAQLVVELIQNKHQYVSLINDRDVRAKVVSYFEIEDDEIQPLRYYKSPYGQYFQTIKDQQQTIAQLRKEIDKKYLAAAALLDQEWQMPPLVMEHKAGADDSFDNKLAFYTELKHKEQDITQLQQRIVEAVSLISAVQLSLADYAADPSEYDKLPALQNLKAKFQGEMGKQLNEAQRAMQSQMQAIQFDDRSIATAFDAFEKEINLSSLEGVPTGSLVDEFEKLHGALMALVKDAGSYFANISLDSFNQIPKLMAQVATLTANIDAVKAKIHHYQPQLALFKQYCAENPNAKMQFDIDRIEQNFTAMQQFFADLSTTQLADAGGLTFTEVFDKINGGHAPIYDLILAKSAETLRDFAAKQAQLAQRAELLSWDDFDQVESILAQFSALQTELSRSKYLDAITSYAGQPFAAPYQDYAAKFTQIERQFSDCLVIPAPLVDLHNKEAELFKHEIAKLDTLEAEMKDCRTNADDYVPGKSETFFEYLEHQITNLLRVIRSGPLYYSTIYKNKADHLEGLTSEHAKQLRIRYLAVSAAATVARDAINAELTRLYKLKKESAVVVETKEGKEVKAKSLPVSDKQPLQAAPPPVIAEVKAEDKVEAKYYEVSTKLTGALQEIETATTALEKALLHIQKLAAADPQNKVDGKHFQEVVDTLPGLEDIAHNIFLKYQSSYDQIAVLQSQHPDYQSRTQASASHFARDYKKFIDSFGNITKTLAQAKQTLEQAIQVSALQPRLDHYKDKQNEVKFAAVALVQHAQRTDLSLIKVIHKLLAGSDAALSTALSSRQSLAFVMDLLHKNNIFINKSLIKATLKKLQDLAKAIAELKREEVDLQQEVQVIDAGNPYKGAYRTSFNNSYKILADYTADLAGVGLLNEMAIQLAKVDHGIRIENELLRERLFSMPKLKFLDEDKIPQAVAAINEALKNPLLKLGEFETLLAKYLNVRQASFTLDEIAFKRIMVVEQIHLLDLDHYSVGNLSQLASDMTGFNFTPQSTAITQLLRHRTPWSNVGASAQLEFGSFVTSVEQFLADRARMEFLELCHARVKVITADAQYADYAKGKSLTDATTRLKALKSTSKEQFELINKWFKALHDKLKLENKRITDLKKKAEQDLARGTYDAQLSADIDREIQRLNALLAADEAQREVYQSRMRQALMDCGLNAVNVNLMILLYEDIAKQRQNLLNLHGQIEMLQAPAHEEIKQGEVKQDVMHYESPLTPRTSQVDLDLAGDGLAILPGDQAAITRRQTLPSQFGSGLGKQREDQDAQRPGRLIRTASLPVSPALPTERPPGEKTESQLTRSDTKSELSRSFERASSESGLVRQRASSRLVEPREWTSLHNHNAPRGQIWAVEVSMPGKKSAAKQEAFFEADSQHHVYEYRPNADYQKLKADKIKSKKDRFNMQKQVVAAMVEKYMESKLQLANLVGDPALCKEAAAQLKEKCKAANRKDLEIRINGASYWRGEEGDSMSSRVSEVFRNMLSR